MLKSPLLKVITGALLLALAGFVVAAFAVSGEPVTAQQMSTTPTPVPTRQMPGKMPGKIGTGQDWIIIDLPPDAAQIDYGHEIYRLVCSACHGDIGQGLTPEWRSTWAPEDQNCWQSKCHAPNHPPEGFIMPVAPAINNLTQRSTFPTALQLQAYIHAAMPWYKPGSLTDERAWQVTAYVLNLNGIDARPMLNAETAAKIRLAPDMAAAILGAETASSGTGEAQNAIESPASSSTLLLSAGALAVILLLVGGIFLRRSFKR